MRGISRFNFHLNEEHDYYLIEFIQSHKNQSRVIRDLLRAGYTILQGKNTTINTSKIKQKETTKDTSKDMKKETTPTTKIPPNEKIQWKIPKN